MSVQQPSDELWGAETRKAVANFPVSGEPVPVAVVRWLGRIKGTAARANAELGLLDSDLAERIAAAADEIAQGRHDGQFPVDVFQTGSGTSSNMNANEVIAALAGEGGDRLVAGAHARRGARARLEDVDGELPVVAALGDLVRGGRDALGEVGVEQPDFGVGARSGRCP